jgi:hypothetical protein
MHDLAGVRVAKSHYPVVGGDWKKSSAPNWSMKCDVVGKGVEFLTKLFILWTRALIQNRKARLLSWNDKVSLSLGSAKVYRIQNNVFISLGEVGNNVFVLKAKISCFHLFFLIGTGNEDHLVFAIVLLVAVMMISGFRSRCGYFMNV